MGFAWSGIDPPGLGESPVPWPVAGGMEEPSRWCWRLGKHWVGFIGQLGGEQPSLSWSP